VREDAVINDRDIYLFRHGRTALNADGVIRGRVDAPLDDTGRREADALGALFANVPLAVVVTSPLSRAVSTAEAIAADTGVPVTPDPRLVDRDYGPYQGRVEEHVHRLLRERTTVPGIETAGAVRRRARGAVEDALARHPIGAIAFVAHDAVNRLLLVELVPSLGDPTTLPQATACWNHLRGAGATWKASVVGAVPADGRRP
jgi:glucosyl-3-phosphoglycerate phosphatase